MISYVQRSFKRLDVVSPFFLPEERWHYNNCDYDYDYWNDYA